MAPTLDASTPAAVYNDTAGVTSLVTASFTPPSGSIVVAKVTAGDAGTTSTTPTGLTFTSQLNIGTGGSTCRVAIYTATGGGSAVTVTAAFGGTGNVRSLVVEVWTGAQLAATPATHSTNTTTPPTGAPTDTITTTGANSVVTWINADYSAVDGTSRTYRSSAVETGYHTVSLQDTVYCAYQGASAGSQTYGLTAPTGQTYTLASVEIQGTTATQDPRQREIRPPWRLWARDRSSIFKSTYQLFAPQGDISTATLVSLADTGAGVDAITESADVGAGLADTGVGTDALTVAAAVPLPDTGTVSDSLTPAAAVSLADVGTGTDALTVTVAAPLTDTSAAADTLSATAAVQLTDTGTGTDALTLPSTLIIQTVTAGSSSGSITASWPTTLTAGSKRLAVINSDTTVSTPSGWTLRASAVGTQGFYIWEQTTAGTNDTPTFTTSGSFQTSLSLIEADGTRVNGFDVQTVTTEASGVSSLATTATTTAGTIGDLNLAIYALHGIDNGFAPVPTPTYDNGFTHLLTSTRQTVGGVDNSAVQHYIATLASSSAGTVGATTANWSNTVQKAYAAQVGFVLQPPAITLADTGTGTDGLTVAASAPLTDAATGTDALTVSAQATLADAAAGVDSLAVAGSTDPNQAIPAVPWMFAQPELAAVQLWGDASTTPAPVLTETATGTEGLTVAAATALAETATGADVLSVTVLVSLTDTGHGTDAFTETVSVPLADTVTGTDSLTVTATVPLAEVGSGVDDLSVGGSASKSLPDTATGADALTVTVSPVLADTGTGTDSLAVVRGIPLGDTATGVDALSVTVTTSLADLAAAVEAIFISGTLPGWATAGTAPAGAQANAGTALVGATALAGTAGSSGYALAGTGVSGAQSGG
jgi:hypothetical protein